MSESGFDQKLHRHAQAVRLQLTWYALALLSIVAMIAWYGFLEPPYLTYPSLPFEVSEEPHPGEAVALKVKRCNADSIERTYFVSHVLVSIDDPKERILLPPGPVQILPGCTTETSRVNVVPLGIPIGRYYYVEGHAEVQGTIRTHSVPWRSALFKILPPVKGSP